MSPRFELSGAELEFLGRNWLVTELTGAMERRDRVEFIRRCAEGDELANVPEPAAAVIKRYAPVAVVMNEFYGKLHLESRNTPYPADEIQRVCAATGFEPMLSIQRVRPAPQVGSAVLVIRRR